MVGGNEGVAHRQQQGTGNATILQGNEAIGAAKDYAGYRLAQRKAKEDASEAKKNAVLTEFSKFNPEFWSKNNDEKRVGMETLRNKFVTAMQSGATNPYQGTDDASKAFQEEYQKMIRMSQLSKDKEEFFKSYQGVLQGKDPEEFTAESLAGVKDYLDKPLSASLDSEDIPPMIESRRPFLNRIEKLNTLVTTVESKMKGMPLQDDEKMALISDQLSDANNGGEWMRTYAESFKNMPPEELSALKTRAKQAGRSDVQQAMKEDMDMLSMKREPLNVVDELTKIAGKIDIQSVSTNNAGTGGTFPKKGEMERLTRKAAKDMVTADYRWLTELDKPGELPRDPKETDSDYRIRVEAELAKRMSTYVKKPDISTFKAKDDVEGDAFKASGDRWLADMKSGLIQNENEAASVLKDFKLNSGYVIQDAKVVTLGTPYPTRDAASPGSPTMGKNLELVMETPASPQKVQEEIETSFGLKKGDVTFEKKGLKTVMYIPVDKIVPNDNQLLDLYYRKAKSTGQNYEGVKFAPKTVDDLKKTENLNMQNNNPSPLKGVKLF